MWECSCGRALSISLKITNALRGLGWPSGAIIFALAMFPVLELPGAILVGYWLQLNPVILTVLSVLGIMVPVPFVVLYLKRFASFLAKRIPPASWFLDLLFKRAKEKAGTVKEFQWLGLMLFVAVPFLGLMNLGLKYALVTGIILFFLSTIVWSVLRNLRKSLNS